MIYNQNSNACIISSFTYNSSMLKIGTLTLKSNLVLSPLLHTSDLPFRAISREFGCELAFFEPFDAHDLVRRRKNSLLALSSDKTDNPIGAQIIGNEPGIILEAAHIILNLSNTKIINLNFACPLKSVTKKHCGAYFLNEPKKAANIVKRLTASISVPTTIKIRSGYVNAHKSEGLKLARMAEDSGAKGVFFHGRTMQQGFSGKVNYKAISEAKKTLKIPVIGSGNIISCKLAKKMIDETNCDGLLLARGAIGNPWIFKQIKAYLVDPEIHALSTPYEEVLATTQKHIRFYINNKNLTVSQTHYLKKLYKISTWYAKGLPYFHKAHIAYDILRSLALPRFREKA